MPAVQKKLVMACIFLSYSYTNTFRTAQFCAELPTTVLHVLAVLSGMSVVWTAGYASQLLTSDMRVLRINEQSLDVSTTLVFICPLPLSIMFSSILLSSCNHYWRTQDFAVEEFRDGSRNYPNGGQRSGAGSFPPVEFRAHYLKQNFQLLYNFFLLSPV